MPKQTLTAWGFTYLKGVSVFSCYVCSCSAIPTLQGEFHIPHSLSVHTVQHKHCSKGFYIPHSRSFSPLGLTVHRMPHKHCNRVFYTPHSRSFPLWVSLFTQGHTNTATGFYIPHSRSFAPWIYPFTPHHTITAAGFFF